MLTVPPVVDMFRTKVDVPLRTNGEEIPQALWRTCRFSRRFAGSLTQWAREGSTTKQRMEGNRQREGLTNRTRDNSPMSPVPRVWSRILIPTPTNNTCPALRQRQQGDTDENLQIRCRRVGWSCLRSAVSKYSSPT